MSEDLATISGLVPNGGGPVESKELEPFKVKRVSELEIKPHEWLVEGLWAKSGVGIIGGVPKSCKTFLGLDIALS
ncbi:MAG: AAA family ATPase, partial [Myxococcota bacterium]